MGACISSEGDRTERRVPAETSQTAPVESAVLGSELAESVVTEEAAHTEFISNHGPERHISGKEFTFEELHAATGGFRQDGFLGQGGFGPVFKGVLDGTNEEVAIKLLDLNGQQGNKEFLTEVMMLSKLHHPNLVKLVGYCSKLSHRCLVYEYMPLGSLYTHLHDLSPGQQPLDWSTRMRILIGAAKGLHHLHAKADPPVINRDVKCANILLGEGYHPKVSDFGLAKLGPTGDDTHVSTRVMGTAGYCAPEYFMSGKLTTKSDVYSFGVVMLEVLTGRMAKDDRLPTPERTLAKWAPTLINPRDFHKLADPAMQGQYHATSLFRVLTVAALCVHESPSLRPPMAEVVEALTEISEMESKSRRRLARRRSGPSTPTGAGPDGSQPQDQGGRS
ncbi:hypothetical protein ACP70R_017382 [Stipagrostis hirtigluma subsp. patula]